MSYLDFVFYPVDGKYPHITVLLSNKNRLFLKTAIQLPSEKAINIFLLLPILVWVHFLSRFWVNFLLVSFIFCCIYVLVPNACEFLLQMVSTVEEKAREVSGSVYCNTEKCPGAQDDEHVFIILKKPTKPSTNSTLYFFV